MKNDEKKMYIRPEDVVKITQKNLRKWKTLDKIDENLSKILWYLEDERYDRLAQEFNLEV